MFEVQVVVGSILVGGSSLTIGFLTVYLYTINNMLSVALNIRHFIQAFQPSMTVLLSLYLFMV